MTIRLMQPLSDDLDAYCALSRRKRQDVIRFTLESFLTGGPKAAEARMRRAIDSGKTLFDAK